MNLPWSWYRARSTGGPIAVCDEKISTLRWWGIAAAIPMISPRPAPAPSGRFRTDAAGLSWLPGKAPAFVGDCTVPTEARAKRERKEASRLSGPNWNVLTVKAALQVWGSRPPAALHHARVLARRQIVGIAAAIPHQRSRSPGVTNGDHDLVCWVFQMGHGQGERAPESAHVPNA